MKRVERTEVVMVLSQQRAGFAQRNPYAMDMDRNNRNYYACGRFGHITRHYRNRGANVNRRMETEDNNNLNRNGGLMDPN